MPKHNKWAKNIAGEKSFQDFEQRISEKSNILKTRKSPETLKNKSPVPTQHETQNSPGSGSDAEEDMFMRQISITDCDSPKRFSVRSNKIDFEETVSNQRFI